MSASVESSTPRSAGVALLDPVFFALSSLFATWVLLTQAALLLGLTMRTLFLLFDGALVLGLFLAIGVWSRRRGRLPPVERELGWLLALSLACGLLSYGFIRPEVDDINYAARAVFFLSNLDRPLDLAFHDHAFFEEPLRYPLLLTYAGEFFWAHLAWLLRIEFLDAYHLIAPFIGGALIPLAWALVISRFGVSTRGATLGALFVCAYLCADGVSHHGFGNYAFVRIWHGKALLLSLVVPLFVAFALEWLRKPRFYSWIKLFAVAVSGSGLSGTSLFLLPLLALALAGGHVAARGLGRRVQLEVLGLGAVLCHTVLIGLLLRLSVDAADYRYLGFEVGFPESFGGQLAMVFPSSPPIAIVFFLVSGSLSLLLLPPERMRFLLGWFATIVLIALNPVVMPLIVEHLSTWNSYWRVFYALPFPLCAGLAVALVADRQLRAPAAAITAGVLLIGITAAANALAPGPTTLGGLRFEPGSYKLRPLVGKEIRELSVQAAPGSMLAPYRISTALPLVSADFPQVFVDGYFLLHFGRLQNQRADAESRHRAAFFVGGLRSTGLDDVRRVLEKGVQNVVVARRQIGHPGLSGLLRQAGLTRVVEMDRLVLFRRPDGVSSDD